MGARTSKFCKSKQAADPAKFIKKAIAKGKVVVFSKSYCPHCKLAKEIFAKLNQPIKVYELDHREDGAAIQDALNEITGFRTVPQVFIKGKCVGGGSDVNELYQTGKLKPMLA